MEKSTECLSVATKASERELLQIAAERVGTAESTFVREMALTAARALLKPLATEDGES